MTDRGLADTAPLRVIGLGDRCNAGTACQGWSGWKELTVKVRMHSRIVLLMNNKQIRKLGHVDGWPGRSLAGVELGKII